MSKALDWKAAVWAGIIAGVGFLMLEMALVALVHGMSPWGPPRMMAAMVMGEGVLPPPATFDIGIVMVAMMIHVPLAIIYGIILGWVISKWELGLGASVVAGPVFGLVIYFVNFYGFTAIWPWFAMARNLISIFAHVMFGLVLGWAYHAIAGSSLAVDETTAAEPR